MPSIFMAARGLDVIVELVPAAAQPGNASLSLSDAGQASAVSVSDQGGSQQDGQTGAGNALIQNEIRGLVALNPQPVPAQYGKLQQNSGQSTGANGSVGGQGDAQNGQSGDSGSTNPLGDGQGDQAVIPDNGSSGSSDAGEGGADDLTSQGGSPTEHGGGHCHRNGSSAGQSEDQVAPVDPSQVAAADQGSPIGQDSSAGAANTTGQGNTVLPSPSEGKTSNNPADPLAGNPDYPASAEVGVGTSAAANTSGSSSEKKQHTPSDASIVEAGQRGQASVQDGKQPSSDGTLATAEDVRGLLAMRSPGAEQASRIQADAQSVQQNQTDDPPQRPVAERLRGADASRGPALVESLFPPGEEALFVDGLPDDAVRAIDYGYGSPQKPELLTNSLSLDFSSLRAEVRRFFEHMDRLGGHATDRQVGLVLCSLAVVVTSAMACEVAWRQARRPAVNPPLALASTLDLADDAESPAAAGLPHFGQFSALS